MVIADHLDMVGVQLKASWIQTRKVNGDIIQQRVSSTINSWRAGKFMPLSMRPWSVNSYVLSKVWFKCGTVDLRVADITAIQSSVKSWLYADLLEKPSELVMCRPSSYGGLEVTSVKHKAQAVLIRNFLESAANPKFRKSLLHTILFRYHVLEDRSVPNPGYLPYYPQTFFDTIKRVHQDTPLNVRTMSTTQWVRILTEDGLTMELGPGQVKQYIPCKAEISFLHNDWEQSWRLCRLKGIGSDLASFNFKLLHGLLVTKERMHHLNPHSSPSCTLCHDQTPEDIQHAMFHCPFNHGVGETLLSVVQDRFPNTTPAQFLLLEVQCIADSQELSMIIMISTWLMEIWERRLKKQRIRLYDIRATLEAHCLLLRKTRYTDKISLLHEILSTSLV